MRGIVPDLQENEWEELGYISGSFEINQTEDVSAEYDARWTQMAYTVQRMQESFTQLGPVVVELGQALASALCNEEEMINIRRGEYPGWDSYGTYWYDPSGMHTDVAGNCFICGTSTYRLDIDLHAHFCNQTECNDEIRRQLEGL